MTAPPEDPALIEALEGVVGPLFEALPREQTGSSVPTRVWAGRERRAREHLVDVLLLRGEPTVPETVKSRLADLVQRWYEAGFDGGFEEVDALELEFGAVDPETQHRQRLRERYGYVELFGLQVQARVFMDLDVLYLPQRLRTERMVEETLGDAVLTRAVELPVDELLEQGPRACVRGGPGSGKTTLLRYLATRPDERRLPFLVAARSLEAPLTVESIAAANGAAEDLLTEAIADGRAALLLDGVDEAREPPRLMEELGALLAQFPDLPCVISSRPAGLRGLEVPESLEPMELTALTRPEVDEFIERWCRAAEIKTATGQAGATAERRGRKTADDLKARLRKSPAVADLAKSPLLASVLCVVHRFLGRRIPERRAALYEAATNVLLYEWDAAKFGEGARIGTLDAAQKKVLLGDLALRMLEAGEAEWPEDRVAECFSVRLEDVGGDPKDAGAILAEIRDRSGLLVEVAPTRFAFSHLTYQEYLAAHEIVRIGDPDRLLEHRDDPEWHETILLAAGLPNGPVVSIVETLLERGLTTDAMLAARAVHEAIAVPRSVRERVQRSVARLVPPTDPLRWSELAEIGQLAGPLLMPGLNSPVPLMRARSAAGVVACGYALGLREVVALLVDDSMLPYDPTDPHSLGANMIPTGPLNAVVGGSVSAAIGELIGAHLLDKPIVRQAILSLDPDPAAVESLEERAALPGVRWLLADPEIREHLGITAQAPQETEPPTTS